jgi:glycosyltransferase involved in cell wall biosynthesis
MPIYKTKEEHLRCAIDSVLNQSFKDFEFIILNDSKEDVRLKEIIDSFSDERIRYYENEINLGIAKTQLTQRRNQREIKNLKSDYTSKAARLQYQSKQGEVEIRLKAAGSKVEKPKQPARLVKLPQN